MYTPSTRYATFSVWRSLRLGVCVALLFALSSCGFHLKQAEPLPFTRLYTNISDNSPFGAQLRRQLKASSPSIQFVKTQKEAQAQLIQISNQRYTRELSIDPHGQVEDYELTIVLRFQLLNAEGQLVLPPTTLSTSRDMPYDTTAVQAKQGEIAALFASMEQSLISRLVRHLTAQEVYERFDDTDLPYAEEGPKNQSDNANKLVETLPLPIISDSPSVGY